MLEVILHSYLEILFCRTFSLKVCFLNIRKVELLQDKFAQVDLYTLFPIYVLHKRTYSDLSLSSHFKVKALRLSAQIPYYRVKSL